MAGRVRRRPSAGAMALLALIALTVPHARFNREISVCPLARDFTIRAYSFR